ncbi:hypothetical protein DFP72DRAFT_945843 [Ephemerocybe angulata]|uniref:BTB domain-containing protein n=1 Tax=Ephemerocybe angulata TaxID=980116 RepID=A0A8H6LU73_9AGAR|nr:hypothetical protein DFP72DRAFT_945843 [Tulosesus angulatus]
MRDVSFDHRYYSLKIESTSQLLNLEKNVEQGLVLKTRFLCIVLPIDPIEEAYPDHGDLDTKFTLECGSDDDYQLSEANSDEDDDDGASSSSSWDSETSSIYEHQALEAAGVQELISELEDSRNDIRANPVNGSAIAGLDDIKGSPYPLYEFQHRIYRAIRRLLEACSATLNVFSLFHSARPLLPHCAFLPSLPCLVRLTVKLERYSSCLWSSEIPPVSAIFPSLRFLRLPGTGFPVPWTQRLVDSLPKSHSVSIVTDVLRNRPRAGYRFPRVKVPAQHIWNKDTPSGPTTPGGAVAQWLEDITGDTPDSEEGLIKTNDDEMAHSEDNVRFSIKGTLFRVPRQPFIQGSAYFNGWYRILERVDTADDIVVLHEATVEEFRIFLRLLLLPSHDALPTAGFEKGDWLKVLDLATEWYFREIRNLAITHLESTLSTIERIKAGRRVYYIPWVLSGYMDLVKRPEGISHQEGDEIGQTTRASLMRIRRKLERERGRGMYDDLEEFVEGEILSKFVIEINRLEEHDEEWRKTEERGERICI